MSKGWGHRGRAAPDGEGVLFLNRCKGPLYMSCTVCPLLLFLPEQLLNYVFDNCRPTDISGNYLSLSVNSICILYHVQDVLNVHLNNDFISYYYGGRSCVGGELQADAGFTTIALGFLDQ